MASRMSLRIVRNDACVAWGFRISGGRDFGAPVTIQRVNPSSVADRHGLRPGDLLLSIEEQPTADMKHSEIQLLIKNTEKVLNVEVERNAEPPSTRPAKSDPAPAMAQLKIKGTAMEQPATVSSRFPSHPQPYQASTSETTMPFPYQARSSEVVIGSAVQMKASSAQPEVKVHAQVPVSAPKPANDDFPPPPSPSQLPPFGPPQPSGPPPPPSAVAAGPADLGGETPSPTPSSGPGGAKIADLRVFGSPAPAPPTVAPKPGGERKFSADANLLLGSGPAPWMPQDDRKGSLGESGLQPAGARKQSWDPTSGQSYTAQPWRPPTAVSGGTQSGSTTPPKEGYRKDKTAAQAPKTAQPWKQPHVTNNDRKPSWDKTATLPSMGYTAQPWKPPSSTGDGERKESWDKTVSLPPAGTPASVPQPWRAPEGERKGSWDKTASLPPAGTPASVPQPWRAPEGERKGSSALPQSWRPTEGDRNESWDKSASLPPAGTQAPPAQPWRPTEGERKGSIPFGNGNSGSGKKHEAGVCFHCKEIIRGPYLMALDRVYCADHFRCCKCNVRLDKQPFINHENQVFCQEDYGKFIAEKCAVCGAPIITECLRAMDKAFHPECFTCTLCRQPIAPGNFRLGSDNKPYCEDDWRDNFQVMCSRCEFPIEPEERFIEALNKSFHAECFECISCGMKLEGKPFYNRNDKPYCRDHVPAH